MTLSKDQIHTLWTLFLVLILLGIVLVLVMTTLHNPAQWSYQQCQAARMQSVDGVGSDVDRSDAAADYRIHCGGIND